MTWHDHPPDGSGGRPAIGWLGVGRMGAAMADRLLAAGWPVAIWNRTSGKTGPLVARGGVAVDSIVELARCDIVFVMVSNSADLLEVVTGPAGLLAGSVLPRVIIDCSTVSGPASAQVREAATASGVALLAAPVSGNPHVVAEGRACLIVSGPRQTYQELLPILRELAAVTVFVGEREESRLVKLCLNLYLGMTVQALVEVTTLAEKGGTPRAAFLEVLNGTMLTSEWVQRRSADLVALEWTPTFTTELLRKDFDLGLAAARGLEVPTPIAAAVHQLIQTAIGLGLRHEDFLSLYAAQAATAGLSPEPATPTATSTATGPNQPPDG